MCFSPRGDGWQLPLSRVILYPPLHVKGLQIPVLLQSPHLQKGQLLLAAHTPPHFSHTRTPAPNPLSPHPALVKRTSPRALPKKHLSPAECLHPAASFFASATARAHLAVGWFCCPEGGKAAPAVPVDTATGMARAVAPQPGKTVHCCPACSNPLLLRNSSYAAKAYKTQTASPTPNKQTKITTTTQ